MTTQTRPKPAEKVLVGGGVYVYRTRKPMSVFGLLRPPLWMLAIGSAGACGILAFQPGPWWLGLAVMLFTGRHFAYVGETVSFKDRHREHIIGGGRFARKCQPWSDLDPKCVMRLRLPAWKWLLRSVETTLIFLLCPVYNHKKNLWNPRRITLRSAVRQRKARDRRLRVPLSFNLRTAHLIIIIAVAIFAHARGVI